MGKLDEVKEILNTLRIAMSIAFAIFIVVVMALIIELKRQIQEG